MAGATFRRCITTQQLPRTPVQPITARMARTCKGGDYFSKSDLRSPPYAASDSLNRLGGASAHAVHPHRTSLSFSVPISHRWQAQNARPAKKEKK